MTDAEKEEKEALELEALRLERENRRLAPLRELQRHLRQLEGDYDKAQGGFRQSAAAWIVAGFGAIGVALTLTPLESPFGTLDPRVTVAIIALAADLGLRNLWILDQLVYQQLLHTVFALGLRIELRLKRDERYGTALYALVENAANRISAYYRVPIQVFLILAALSIAAYAVKLAATMCLSCPIDWFGLVTLAALLAFFGLSFVRYIDVVDEVRHDDIEDKLYEMRVELDDELEEKSKSADYAKAYQKLSNKTPPLAYRPWSTRIWDAAENATRKVRWLKVPYFFVRVIVCSVGWLFNELLTVMGFANVLSKRAGPCVTPSTASLKPPDVSPA